MTVLSIIVPCYNEELRLGATLDEIAEFVASRPDDIEVIVVDDGSLDRTAEVAAASSCPNLSVIRYEPNRGKGNAVRVGMLAAVGDLRLFTDADGSTRISEYGKLEAALDRQENPGVAFASIGVPGSRVVEPQAGLRPLAGRIGNRLIRLLALPGVYDSQRGFKLFTAAAAESVFSRSVVDGWAFDIEVLTLAARSGFDIVEVPVCWTHKNDSRVTLLSYLTTLADLVRIRWRFIRGAYE